MDTIVVLVLSQNNQKTGKDTMDKSNIKSLNLRLPRDLWYFMRVFSAQQDKSLNQAIIDGLTYYKNNMERLLPFNDTIVK